MSIDLRARYRPRESQAKRDDAGRDAGFISRLSEVVSRAAEEIAASIAGPALSEEPSFFFLPSSPYPPTRRIVEFAWGGSRMLACRD